MSVWTKRIEFATNIAILSALVLVCAVAAKRLWEPIPRDFHNPAIGTKISLPGVDWSKSNQHLVLALSTGCHFCSESAGFYQRLIPAAVSYGIRVLAVLPQPVSEDRVYLDKLGVTGAEAMQSSLSTMDVSGTPSLLLVDNQGRIRKAWVGKLDSEQEQQVLAGLH